MRKINPISTLFLSPLKLKYALIAYLVRPNLGNIEGIETILCGILRFHNLDINRPRRIFTMFNGIEEITSSIIRIRTSKLTSLIGLQVSNTLICLEMPFDILEATILSNQFQSVRRITVKITVTIWSTTVREENRNLMNRFRNKRQEIPESIGITTVGLRVSLLGVNKVYNLANGEPNVRAIFFIHFRLSIISHTRELCGITNKEDRSVVTNHIPISYKQIVTLNNYIHNKLYV